MPGRSADLADTPKGLSAVKTTLAILAAAVLLVAAPGRCFALRSISPVSKEQAKEMGIEVRTQGNGPQVWVELEFKPEGKLKDFRQVELEIYEGDKFLVGYAPLRGQRLDSGRILVRFLADRGYVDKISLTLVAGPLSDVGYELRVKDFVGPAKNR